MASYTTNLNLKKPAGSENVAIGDINNNMDLIDSAIGLLSTVNGTFTAADPSGKITSVSGTLKRSGGLKMLDISVSMNDQETTNWIKIGSVDMKPASNVSANFISDSLFSGGKIIRCRVSASSGNVEVFFGGAANFYIHMIYI